MKTAHQVVALLSGWQTSKILTYVVRKPDVSVTYKQLHLNTVRYVLGKMIVYQTKQWDDNLQPIATRGKKARGTLLVNIGCSRKRAPLSVSYYNEISSGHIGSCCCSEEGLCRPSTIAAPVLVTLQSLKNVCSRSMTQWCCNNENTKRSTSKSLSVSSLCLVSEWGHSERKPSQPRLT